MKTEILPAVSAIIFNEQGDVLLQRRKDTGKWCIISGHVEFGESIEQAIVREIREELGVSSSVKRLIGVYSSPAYTTYYYPDRTVQYVVTYFEVGLLEKVEAGLANAETIAIDFFDPENLPHDLDLVNPNWLADAVNTRAEAFIR
jgi:8-oxo-dGTP pyrophosphatase MutT (NUDIX family)